MISSKLIMRLVLSYKNSSGTDTGVSTAPDIAIYEEGRVKCHRCILMARSPVFNAMFSHNMTESQNGEIFIPDFSLPVVQILIFFIYSGKLEGIFFCFCFYFCFCCF